MTASTALHLPLPGTTLHVDYRSPSPPPPRSPASASASAAAAPGSHTLRLLTFNNERGYQLPAIIELLHKYDADIIALQEVDCSNDRSGSVDVGRAIAQSLQLNYLFVCEFEELHSTVRKLRDQGGGVHGNAILTKLDISDPHVLTHTVEPCDWNTEGVSRGEPRRGRRYTLNCTVHVPNRYHVDAEAHREQSTWPLQVYTAHLELFCGLSHRLAAVADIFHHYGQLRAQRGIHHAAILGDFNTLAHSIARLSPKYCKDSYRWKSLGYTEAEWLAKHVLNVYESDFCSINSLVDSALLDADTRQKLVNPHFVDPFDAYEDVTLRSYRGLFQGKLDWLLLRQMKVIAMHIDNHGYHASDHKMLAVDCQLSDQLDARLHKLTRPRPGMCTYSTSLGVLAMQTALVAAFLAVMYAHFS